jgi:hypothetical protein
MPIGLESVSLIGDRRPIQQVSSADRVHLQHTSPWESSVQIHSSWMLCYITERMVPTFYNHHTALKHWAPITHTSRETSDIGQLLKVPSDRNLVFFLLWCTQTSVVLQLSDYNMYMVRATPNLAGCYRESGEMHEQFCIPQTWNEALCNRHQQKTDWFTRIL